MGEADGRQWGPTLTGEQWNTVLKRQGFSGVDTELRESEDPKDSAISIIISTALPIKPNELPTDTLLVLPDRLDTHTSELSRYVQDCITSQSEDLKVSCIALSELSKVSLQDKHCISMVEAAIPLLINVNDTDFDSVKRIILESTSCTWLTRGGAVDGEDPSCNLMTGTGRTIRAEDP